MWNVFSRPRSYSRDLISKYSRRFFALTRDSFLNRARKPRHAKCTRDAYRICTVVEWLR